MDFKICINFKVTRWSSLWKKKTKDKRSTFFLPRLRVNTTVISESQTSIICSQNKLKQKKCSSAESRAQGIGLTNQFVKNEHKFSPAPSNFSVGFLVLARKLSWSDLYKSSPVEFHRFISFFLYRKNSFSTVFCESLHLLCCMLPFKDFYTYGCDHDEKQTCSEKHTCQTWIQLYAKRHFILLNGLYNEV